MQVLLIGDTILDIYTYGKALGLSSETPTIVARKGAVQHNLGGAALVCRNLLELGAMVRFVTLVGDDDEARHVRGFEADRLEVLAVTDVHRPTTVKHRFWVDGYKLFQLDTRDDAPIPEVLAESVLAKVDSCLAESNVVVISDYRHGLLTPNLLAKLMPRLRKAGKPVYVDSQVAQNASNHLCYSGGAVMCLNLKEARAIDPQFEPAQNVGALAVLAQALDTNSIAVKLGDEGALMLSGRQVAHVPASKVRAVDPTGAGDAFLSALCLAGLSDPDAALRIANAWAGLSVEIHGTAPPKRSDLIRLLGV